MRCAHSASTISARVATSRGVSRAAVPCPRTRFETSTCLSPRASRSSPRARAILARPRSAVTPSRGSGDLSGDRATIAARGGGASRASSHTTPACERTTRTTRRSSCTARRSIRARPRVRRTHAAVCPIELMDMLDVLILAMAHSLALEAESPAVLPREPACQNLPTSRAP